MSDEPQTAEPMPVQLTRIEGVVNLIAYQLGDLTKKVERHELDITALKLAQATNSGAANSWRTWLPILASLAGLALALYLAAGV